jgi:hypothetical protein
VWRASAKRRNVRDDGGCGRVMVLINDNYPGDNVADANELDEVLKTRICQHSSWRWCS